MIKEKDVCMNARNIQVGFAKKTMLNLLSEAAKRGSRKRPETGQIEEEEDLFGPQSDSDSDRDDARKQTEQDALSLGPISS